MEDVTKELQPKCVSDKVYSDYANTIQEIADGSGFYDTVPIQPVERLPEQFKGMKNGHNGTHHFLIDDFRNSNSFI